MARQRRFVLSADWCVLSPVSSYEVNDKMATADEACTLRSRLRQGRGARRSGRQQSTRRAGEYLLALSNTSTLCYFLFIPEIFLKLDILHAASMHLFLFKQLLSRIGSRHPLVRCIFEIECCDEVPHKSIKLVFYYIIPSLL